jgi:hypothetical protein
MAKNLTAGSGNPGKSGKVNLPVITFQTSRGAIDILYDLQTDGRTLHLKDIVIFPRKAQPLRGVVREVVRELLAARSGLAEYAKELGFDKVRITGYRTLQSSSANPGKKVDVTVKIV